MIRAAILALLLTIPSHDKSEPLADWFKSLASKKGPCCSDADHNALKDTDWRSASGHYQVYIDGKWLDVPPEAVVETPNRFGQTVVWLYHVNGMPVIRCFLPGSMT